MTQEIINARLDVISWEALPSLVASAPLFPNIPDGTEVILFTLRTQGITVSLVGPGYASGPTGRGRSGGNKPGIAATANANGLDFGINYAGSPYVWPFEVTHAKRVVAIEQAPTATGYIYYCKRVAP